MENENSIVYDAKKKQFRGLLDGKPFIIEDRGAFMVMISEEKMEVLKIADYRKILEKCGYFLKEE